MQTGCEILVKLEDVVDKAGPQYYATRNLQEAYKHGGICEKPGERCVAGDTGLPTVHTAEIAVQSEEDVRPLHIFDTGSGTNGDSFYSTTNQHVKNGSSVPSVMPSNHEIKSSSPSILPSSFTNRKTPRAEPSKPPIVKQIMRSTHADFGNTTTVDIEPNNSETTTAGVKMEVRDVTEDEDADQQYQNDILSTGDENDNGDDIMAPLTNEEDFYEDHFGSAAEFEGASSQSLSQSTLIQHQR